MEKLNVLFFIIPTFEICRKQYLVFSIVFGKNYIQLIVFSSTLNSKHNKNIKIHLCTMFYKKRCGKTTFAEKQNERNSDSFFYQFDNM